MNAIEAMARAICRDWLMEESGIYPELDADIERRWMSWEEAARAALTALRDNGVTDNMLEAGGEAVQSQSYNNAALARLTFRAMLDAALES